MVHFRRPLTMFLLSLFRCEWNIYTIRYAVALSKQRGLKRSAEQLEEGEEEEEEEEEVVEDEDLFEGMSQASMENTVMVM